MPNQPNIAEGIFLLYRDSIPFCTHRMNLIKMQILILWVIGICFLRSWFGDYRSLRFLCGYFGSRTFYLGVFNMKIGFRTPSLKKSFKARTTGKLKRKIKKSINPFYEKKGVGFIKNPKRSIKNKIYKKTTFGLSDIFRKLK